ncbi:DMP19 family protein [Empedobacter falsenii]|uniref:DNA mimic protein DMP19 C-terminal domain-containing protein n=1 Tax=Empedobacter falsenii TaxID=343874 RepID=A0A376GG49_9FLAO|nr:DMP19 family protein [Empedobacter falsenii]STD59181.1 Uncharacterised protein [Empedobacter falsenii]
MANYPELETLLQSNEIDDILISLDNYINELCEYGENINVLTKPQMTFFLNQNFEKEINNGGLNQFFYNSSGEFSFETVQSLKEIKAFYTATILEEAICQFPNNNVPKDRDSREEIIEEIEHIANDVWEDLDSKLYEYEDNLSELNLSYIRNNIKYF